MRNLAHETLGKTSENNTTMKLGNYGNPRHHELMVKEDGLLARQGYKRMSLGDTMKQVYP